MRDDELGLIAERIGTLTEAVDEYDSPDMAGLAMYLADVRELKAALALMESTIEARLVPLIPRTASPEQRSIEGVGVLEVRGGTTRKVYDNDLVISVTQTALTEQNFRVDEPTGEIIQLSDQEQVSKAVQTMARLTGATTPSFNSWRSGVATELGVDLKRYVTDSEPSAYKVVIRGA